MAKKWTKTPAALFRASACMVFRLAAVVVLLGASSLTCVAQWDKYGGSTNLRCTGGVKAHFYTEKIGTRWWLCTPAGNVFWAVGIYNAVLDSGTDKYGINVRSVIDAKYRSGPTTSPAFNWYSALVSRLRNWGWNTMDMYGVAYLYPWTVVSNWPKDSEGVHAIPNKLPGYWNTRVTTSALLNDMGAAPSPIKNLFVGVRRAAYNGWPNYTVADYYDGAFPAVVAARLGKPPAVNNDWIIAVISDDSDYLSWTGAGTDFPTYPAGKVSPHGGWVALVTSPLQSYSAPFGSRKLYSDQSVYTKLALRDFLKARYGDIAALNSAWGAAYTDWNSKGVRVTETVGIGDGSNRTFTGTLSKPPDPYSIQFLCGGVVCAGDDGNGRIFALANSGSITNYSTAAGSGASMLTLNWGLPAPRGASITANYRSDGRAITRESIGVGDGAARIFTYKMANRVDPGSLRIFVADAPKATDGGTGRIVFSEADGIGAASYSAPYGVSVTFAGAPAAGVPVQVGYVSGGFGSGGGLLDEDGSGPWVPATGNTNVLSKKTGSSQTDDRQYATVVQDLDDFFFQYASRYFRINRETIRSQWGDGYLYAGPSSLGAWSTPSRKEVYRAAAGFLDVLRIFMPALVPAAIPDFNARFEFVASYADRPWTSWMGATVCPDGYFGQVPHGASAPVCPGSNPAYYSTQAEKAVWYSSVVNYMVGGSQQGTRHFVGLDLWELIDNRAEGTNWGILTRLDNAYDGREAVAGTVACSSAGAQEEWAYQCGGEARDYGAFLTPGVVSANRSWIPGNTPVSRGGAPPRR